MKKKNLTQADYERIFSARPKPPRLPARTTSFWAKNPARMPDAASATQATVTDANELDQGGGAILSDVRARIFHETITNQLQATVHGGGLAGVCKDDEQFEGYAILFQYQNVRLLVNKAFEREIVVIDDEETHQIDLTVSKRLIVREMKTRKETDFTSFFPILGNALNQLAYSIFVRESGRVLGIVAS